MKSLWKRLVLSAIVIGTGAGMTSSVFAQSANDAGVVRLGKAKAAPKGDVVKSEVVQTSASAQCAPPACAAPACAAPAATSCAPACAAPAATSCAPACAAPSGPSCAVPSAPACAAPCAPSCAPSCANPSSCGPTGCGAGGCNSGTCGTACSVCDPSCGYSNWSAKWRYRAQCNRMAMRQAFSGSCNSGMCDSGTCNTGMCDSGTCNTGMCDSGACYGDGGCKACFGPGRFAHGGFGNSCYGNDCYGNGGFGHGGLGGRGCFGGNGCFGGGHGCFGRGGCNTCGNGNGYGLVNYLNCKFGYFHPTGGGGAGVPWAGHYARVYPVNPHYSDPRDGQAYAAQGYGVPIAVPLAPVVGHAYDYSWGVPSSRLTPISHPAY